MDEDTQLTPGPQGSSAKGHGGKVVVGVDGSEGSLMALRWALEEGRIRGATVHPVMATSRHHTYASPEVETLYVPTAALPSASTPERKVDAGESFSAENDAEAAAHNELDQIVEKVLAEGWHNTVRVVTAAVEGHPAQVLIDSAGPSDLLVISSRGQGRFSAALKESVAQHVLNHAQSPVVVVPHDR